MLNYNQQYFKNRSKNKNALAISSDQSKEITSYQEVISNFNHARDYSDLTICPKYWGGFAFIPYYFEFWEGHESRLNKRIVFKRVKNDWKEFFLQP